MRIFVEFPRWLFLAALVFAPWAYGCTRPWAIETLNAITLTVTCAWMVSCIIRREWPRIPVVLIVAALLLLLQGWWMILNAQYTYDRLRLQFVPVPCLWASGPGVLDRVDAMPAMIRITGLLGVVCFVSDLVQRPRWRTRVWWTIALTGTSIALYGLAVRVGGEAMINPRGEVIDRFFAGYRYHANAGAFINLVFPAIAGLTIVAFGKSVNNPQRALWLPCLVVCLAGAVAACSKAAMVVTALLALAFGFRQAVVTFSEQRRLPSVRAVVVGSLALAAIGIAAVGIGSGAAAEKWMNTGQIGISWEQRWLCYGTCVRMLGDSGAWGFGPGNFMITFPHYTAYLGERIRGIWKFSHQDYLQTLIEWGWVGAGIWAVTFFGGVIEILRNFLKSKRVLPATDRILLFASLLALLGVAAHALVDFPLQIASLQLYAATYLGVAWGSGQMIKGAETGRLPRSKGQTHSPGRMGES